MYAVFTIASQAFIDAFALGTMIFVGLRPFINLGVPQYVISSKFQVSPKILISNLAFGFLVCVGVYTAGWLHNSLGIEDLMLIPFLFAISLSEHVLLRSQSRNNKYSYADTLFPAITRLILLSIVVICADPFPLLVILGFCAIIYAAYSISNISLKSALPVDTSMFLNYLLSNFGQFLMANAAFFLFRFQFENDVSNDYFVAKVALNLVLVPFSILFQKVLVLDAQLSNIREVIEKITFYCSPINVVSTILLAILSCYALTTLYMSQIEVNLSVFEKAVISIQCGLLLISTIIGVVFTRLEYSQFRSRTYLALGVFTILNCSLFGHNLKSILLIELLSIFFLFLSYFSKYVALSKVYLPRE